MDIKKATIKSFNLAAYTAVLELAGSKKAYLEDVPVARSVAPSEAVAGRKAVVLFFCPNNPGDAVVTAVY